MSKSRLLFSHYSDDDDDEFTLNPIHEPLHHSYFNTNHNASSQAEDENSDDDEENRLEAPPSLIIEQTQTTTKPISTREHVTVYDRTMWRWANVENMDDFFQRVYEYYQGKGIYCILLARFLNLLTLAFIILFSTFLIGCINYSDITSHHTLGEVIEPQCLSKLSSTKVLFISIFIIWWIWQAIRFITDLPMLREMHNFYIHLLLIPDEDMQTVSWQTVLERIIHIRESNPNTNDIRLTEHDVASRIMRKENYLIALFNKDILDIQIPLPYLRNRSILTKDLEWNLSFCLLGFIFDNRGQVRKRCLKERNKSFLVASLKRRFIFMGLLNLALSPFIFVYLLLHFFFRYFEEYHKNPSEIGSRAYTPFAKWKFREFNELPHLFRNRISQSYEHANLYINQFPKEKTLLLARFISFLAGSIAGVLALLSLIDSEALLNFEITPNGTVLFYLGLTGTLFAITRNMIPDENQVFEPENVLRKVIEHTHHLPPEWKHKLHTDQVRAEFCKLFDYKVNLFFQELLSVIFAPLVLCLSLPKSADQIVDFFREFTVHVNELGYVCSFAQFDFTRHGNVKYGVQDAMIENDYYLSKQGKMEKSFLNFKANNPKWIPNDLSGSMYLSRLTEITNQKETDSSDERRVQFSQKGRHPAEPIQLNQYGIPSNLGESFVQSQPWKYHVEDRRNEEEEEENEGRRNKGVVGLLNQFYDLNNNPTI
ncbi:autophagy protein Apg9-domain-containing protein [Cokeromyces recurvatus]|uniref:autophagy protein Apg9-domain-containing protein n=1 Tax=Cokeromyces recurvatus TaxID=90255 RepID=UPI00221E522F|nr:autophagy protein Apg9-domain-containing protein [Cokeromyces recurvatus]KAI7898327.1 autophagy protein Apg9-domain-containing protein [Cokeromyces recurvatus]